MAAFRQICYIRVQKKERVSVMKNLIEMPCLDDVQKDLFTLTPEDVEYAKNIFAFVEKEGDQGEFVNLLLGSTLEDLTEPAIWATLAAHYMREYEMVEKGEKEPPKGFTREEWLSILPNERLQPSNTFLNSSLLRLARICGHCIPDDRDPQLVYHKEQFRIITYLREKDAEENEEAERLSTLTGRFLQ